MSRPFFFVFEFRLSNQRARVGIVRGRNVDAQTHFGKSLPVVSSKKYEIRLTE
jgi:hypothetical protein